MSSNVVVLADVGVAPIIDQFAIDRAIRETVAQFGELEFCLALVESDRSEVAERLGGNIHLSMTRPIEIWSRGRVCY